MTEESENHAADTPATDYDEPSTVIDAFSRVGEDGRLVSFKTLDRPDELLKWLEAKHVVCPTDNSEVVVVVFEPLGDRPGSQSGSVSVVPDANHLDSIDLAIRCLQAVRAGLLEPGHTQG